MCLGQGHGAIYDAKCLGQGHSAIYDAKCLGQGHGAIYDAKWCPNELNLAASDSHGHILFFGCSPSPAYKVSIYIYSYL